MRGHEAIWVLGAASALLASACGSGTSNGNGQPDAGMTVVPVGLTPCRDLAPLAASIVPAASSPHFLLTNTLGASVIAIDGWRVLRTFTGHRGYIGTGALAPDASWGATIGDDQALRIWRASDGKETAHLDLQAMPAAVAASPTGDRVAVGDVAGSVTTIDAHSGARQWTTVAGAAGVGSLHFAPDGKTLLVGTPAAFQWRDAASGNLLRSFPDAPDAGASAAGTGMTILPASALSADGTRVAYGFGDALGLSNVQVVSASDATPIGPTIYNVNHLQALAFSKDGTQLLVSSQIGATIYDIAGASARPLISNGGVGALAVSADGETIAAGMFGASFYRFSDGTLLNRFEPTGFGGMFASDGRRLEIPGGGTDGPTQIWDAATGTRVQQIAHVSANGNQGSVIFTPADQLLVIFNGTATTWDVDQGTVASTVTLEGATGFDTFTAAHLTPDGRTLIGYKANALTGDILFWDATTGALVRTVPAHGTNLTALALNRTGDVLASAGSEVGSENLVKLWDVAQGTLLATLTGHTKQIDDLAFSPDGTLLLSGDQYGLVRLWSVPGGQVVRDLATGPFGTTNVAGNNQYGRFVAFSPDGTKVASSGVDWRITNGHTGVIALWSVADGSLVGTLHSLAEANLDHLIWSPAGDLLAAGTGMGMRVWCLDELTPLASAAASAP
jgi:WD40 repeat protein